MTDYRRSKNHTLAQSVMGAFCGTSGVGNCVLGSFEKIGWNAGMQVPVLTSMLKSTFNIPRRVHLGILWALITMPARSCTFACYHYSAMLSLRRWPNSRKDIRLHLQYQCSASKSTEIIEYWKLSTNYNNSRFSRPGTTKSKGPGQWYHYGS